jgi:hypothetical protein
MAQWLSHIRQKVFTGGNLRDISTIGRGPQYRREPVVVLAAIRECNVFFVFEIQRAGEAGFYALWITPTQITLETDLRRGIEADCAERARQHTHFAADTARGIDHDGIRQGIATDGRGGAYLLAPRYPAVHAGQRNTRTLFRVVNYANGRIPMVETMAPPKRTGVFAMAAGHTFSWIHRYNSHWRVPENYETG